MKSRINFEIHFHPEIIQCILLILFELIRVIRGRMHNLGLLFFLVFIRVIRRRMRNLG